MEGHTKCQRQETGPLQAEGGMAVFEHLHQGQHVLTCNVGLSCWIST